MPRNLDSGAKIGSATCLVTLVAIWPQKFKHFFRDHIAGWTGGTQALRLGSAFLAGAFVVWEKHEPWLLLPLHSMTMELAKLLRAPRHAPTQVAKA